MKYILVFITLSFFMFCSERKTTKEFNKILNMNDAYQILDTILFHRKKIVEEYLTAVKDQASQVNSDILMLSTFKIYKEQDSLPRDLQLKLLAHHIVKYPSFNDILFIDSSGAIFNTIMREKDYGKNIFFGLLAKSTLANRLKEKNEVAFVDFQNYLKSKDPAAFFVEPVIKDGKTIGWFAFKLLINNLNMLFHENEHLGRTGEVILVNQDRFMLSNSRFGVHSTILKQKLASENIMSKFLMGAGHKEVIDYRGCAAITSFSTFELMGTRWLIIAKIDRDEIMTEVYKHNADKYDANFIHSAPLIHNSKNMEISPLIYSVHMDEYRRSDSTGILFTKSITTCTAIHIRLPGEFAYLAHISPSDRIYENGSTDLLGYILREISDKEIVRAKMPELIFTIVTPDSLGLLGAIHKIVNAGYFLPQIHIAYHPKALYCDLYSSVKNDSLTALWYLPSNPTKAIAEDLQKAPSLEIPL